MRNGMVKTAVVAVLVGFWTASAAAQQVRFFPDFSSIADLQLNGSVKALYKGQNGQCLTTDPNQCYVLRLTNGPGGNIAPYATTTWFTVPQLVNSGFTTYFRFQIHGGLCCAPGDGFAFVVQNTSSTFPPDPSYGVGPGVGVKAVGAANGGLGYTGLRNSLAVEFDTAANIWDPSINGNNHVAVQSCGTNTNGPVHEAGSFPFDEATATSCLVGGVGGPGLDNSNTLVHLGVNCPGRPCTDGSPHNAVIEYAPVNNVWRLMVYVDPPFIPNTHTPCPSVNIPLGCPVAAVPAINIPYNIDHSQNASTGIALANGTSAWVGFSASQTSDPQVQDILAWEFTPHAPTTVTQTIQGCTSGPNCTPPPTPFTFGQHDTVVNYFPGFQNNGCPGLSNEGPCLMTVVATPTSRSQFYINRLKGTPFANEQCVVYQGTGGNCIVYSITCQTTLHPTVNVACPASLPNTCQDATKDPGCIQFSTSFYTSDGVTPQNADYLKADPPGVNSKDWHSIFLLFDPTGFDPRTSGSGGTPSDFVATFKVGAH